jgi:hypothetical protein
MCDANGDVELIGDSQTCFRDQDKQGRNQQKIPRAQPSPCCAHLTKAYTPCTGSSSIAPGYIRNFALYLQNKDLPSFSTGGRGAFAREDDLIYTSLTRTSAYSKSNASTLRRSINTIVARTNVVGLRLNENTAWSEPKYWRTIPSGVVSNNNWDLSVY